jgi:bacillithiol biosynthesis cysteine-adding enzyme BshC
VPAQSKSSSMTTPFPIDIRRFPWTSTLAADYAFAHGKVAPFYAGDPASDDAWRSAIARVRGHERDGPAVATLLAAQQERRGAPAAARAAAAKLADAATVAVVTGQQAGLFGGPMFTLLKALGALRLTQESNRRGTPAVAIFWIDAEDHDWDEVRTVRTLDADLALTGVELEPRDAGERAPVGQVTVDQATTVAIDKLAQTLPVTEFSDEILAKLRAAYRPGARMADAFGCWLESILGPRGLVVYDAADPAAKPLVANLFAREAEHPGRTVRLAAEAGAALEAANYHAQVSPQPDTLALFALDDGRQGVRCREGGFVIADRPISMAEFLTTVRRSPERFSPNVLLRPLVQDTLFPTVCYVAGPSELAYFGQLRAVYEAFGVPMPLVHTRPSATLLDSSAMRFLSRQQVPLEALRAQDDGILNRLLASQLPPAVETSVSDAAALVTDRMEAIAAAVTAIEPTLQGAARSTAGRMQDDLKKLHNKIIQAAKRKDETLRRQFDHAQAQAFPGGHPQERTIGVVYFLNKYGPGLVDRLDADLPLGIGTHWVLNL